jgi:hypothetical protein
MLWRSAAPKSKIMPEVSKRRPRQPAESRRGHARCAFIRHHRVLWGNKCANGISKREPDQQANCKNDSRPHFKPVFEAVALRELV